MKAKQEMNREENTKWELDVKHQMELDLITVRRLL